MGNTHRVLAASDHRRRLTLPPEEPPRSPYEILREGNRRIVLLRRDPLPTGSILRLCGSLAALPDSPMAGRLSEWKRQP